MTDNNKHRGARRRAVMLAVAAGIALLASGCGGGGRPAGSGASRGANTGHGQEKMLAYSRCVRSHGGPKFPDPSSNGNLQVNGNALGVSSGVLQAAEQACSKLLPGGGGVGARGHGQPEHPQ